MTENQIARVVMDHVKQIHSEYGPGLLENIYEKILVARLRKVGLEAHRQVPVYIEEEGLTNEKAYLIDILVEEKVLLEIKSVKELANVHRMQTLSYLRLAHLKLGLLINFNTDLVLRKGFERIVNGL